MPAAADLLHTLFGQHSATDIQNWFIYKHWKTDDDFEFHMQTGYVTRFLAQQSELLEGEIDIQVFKPVTI